MPSRTAPRLEYASIGRFIGMANDRESFADRKPGHFDLLENWYCDVNKIVKRKGYARHEGVTHATGTRTYGLYNLTGYIGSGFHWAKVTDDDLYLFSGSVWNTFTGRTFPTADTYFAELNGFKQNNSIFNITETVKVGSTATNVLLGSATGPWANDSLAGRVARFTHTASNIEYKVIAGNYYDGTNDRITFNVDDPLNGIPATGIALKIQDENTNLYVAGGGDYGSIQPSWMVAGVSGGTTSQGYTQLDTIQKPIVDGFTGIVSHANRIFGWYQDTVRFSDLYNGHNFGVRSYFKFPGIVQACRPFGDNIIVIYEKRRIWALIGVSPSSWELRLVHDTIGCNYPKTIANYASTSMNMQLFISSDGSVRIITSDTFRAVSREVQIDSVSKDYIHNEFTNNFNWQCGGVDDEGKYHVFRGSTGEFWTLNVRAAEKMAFREWPWAKGQLSNTEGHPNIVARGSGYLYLGATASGQAYIFNDGRTDAGLSLIHI